MFSTINLYSNEYGEINRFLSKFYNTDMGLHDSLKWEKKYINPIEITDLIGTFIDNFDKFRINMWVSLDKDIYIHISQANAENVIRYLYERYPYWVIYYKVNRNFYTF